MLVEYFPYDVTMFWEFFRWERYKIGHVYLQCFPKGKLYAGQSINIIERMGNYRRGCGSNSHHSRAIQYHGWSNVNVLTIQCPWYMLDTVEIFLIEYYDLTDPDKGYNKTTGGRKNWTHSKETLAKMSAKKSGENNVMFGKKGADHPTFGKTWSKTPEQVAKISGENNGMFGKTGADHPAFGTKRTPEQVAKMSGENNGMFGKKGADHPMFGRTGALHHNSKPVCVFGKVYPAAQTASDALRAKYAPNGKKNFIAAWTRIKKHQPYTFIVSDEFYVHAMENNLENITCDLYEKWLKMI
ncbi:GIY-YIG catalytic domain-containing endonuclease [Paramecium bursaria Chlorella virus Can18-4]|nr:GIY-YIG catalytic domain-containing endonuclease [Paramecium bursaria Chlorella virus Can18-4]